MPLFQLMGVTVAFGGQPVLDEVDLQVDSGERLCLLGRNGAGKSTLLQVIRGDLEPDGGSVARQSGLRIAALPQQVPDGLEGTVHSVVTADASVTPRAAGAAISRVGLDPESQVEYLSAGLQRRVLLARALAGAPDVLLLDEPTNHLDLEAIGWLEDFLLRTAPTLVFVTHDRAFLRKLATGILDLDRGHLTRFDADYDRYVEEKQERLSTEARRRSQFDKRHAEEETWIRRGVRERRKRNQGRVERLRQMRAERSERRERMGTVKMSAQTADRTGRVVLRARGLTFSWDGHPVVRDLDLQVDRGDRLGIVGPNGSGKTTLLRLLLGEIEPAAGEVRPGENLEIAYFDQLHRSLDEEASAADNVGHGASMVTVNGKDRHVIGYLADFLFTADQARAPAGLLSGGERNRLLLAKLFARPSNVLVLDEPTNDLDVETLEVLEGLLEDYEGTILFVSHDRELLDGLATSLLVLDGAGGCREVVGGYTEWARIRDAERVETPRPRASTPAAAPKAPPLDKEERRALRALPARIETLEARREAMHERMADPAFFRQDGAEIQQAQAELQGLEEEIATAYARWEALEAKRVSAEA